MFIVKSSVYKETYKENNKVLPPFPVSLSRDNYC